MWIISKLGFYSAVEDRNNTSMVLVRARKEDDIKKASDLTGSRYWEDASADYRWRLRCTKEKWAELVATAALDVDYGNFKESVRDPDRHRIYTDVWWALLALEWDGPPPGEEGGATIDA